MSDQNIGIEKWIEITPAFDKRDTDPSKNYGIHCAEMRWYLRGPKGAIQFVVYTGWDLPHIKNVSRAMGADFGYHSPTPMYDDQSPMSENCEILKGPCYYDGSTLRAEKVFEKLIKEGHAAIWEEMLLDYRERFEKS